MNGQLDWKEMLDSIRNDYLKLFDELRRNKKKLAEDIKMALERDIERYALVMCSKCGSPMIIKDIRQSKKLNLLLCTNCGFSTTIPKAKRYNRTGIKCHICNSEVIFFRTKNEKVYICPVCWKEYGPCYKCPELNNCEIKGLVKKESERNIVGKCECGGELKFVPSKKLVVCSKCGKKYFLPNKGKVRLLKKKCEHHNLRVFSIKEGTKSYYYCIKCGKM